MESSKGNRSYSKEFKDEIVHEYIEDNVSMVELVKKYNIHPSNIARWINLYYNGIENKSYEPKGELYTMKSRKTSYEERVSIVKEVIESDMNYVLAAQKHAITYASVYQWTKNT